MTGAGRMKIAVLGTGSAGRRHLTAIRSLDGVDPIAVPIRSSRVAELATDGFATAPDLNSAVAAGVRAAIIATDTARHAEDTLLALQQGLVVLVEKPLCIDAAEAHRLGVRASKLSRSFYVGCVLRFSESLNMFRTMVDDVGRLHSVRIESQSYLPDWQPERSYLQSYRARANEGGVLLDLIHEIDYAGWLFGWPISLQATLKNFGRLGISADEAADLNWETPEGCNISIRLDYLSRPTRRRMTAFGKRGTIKWDGVAQTVTLSLDDRPVYNFQSNQSRDDMFTAQCSAFIAAAPGAVNPRLATADDGIKALAICDAARIASESRREEMVAYP